MTFGSLLRLPTTRGQLRRLIPAAWVAAGIGLTVLAMTLLGGGAAPAAPKAAVAPAPPAASAPDQAGTEQGGYLLPEYSDLEKSPGGDYGAPQIGWKVGLAFAVVLGLLYLFLQGIRRLSGQRPMPFLHGTRIDVLESIRLAPQQNLYLVDVGNKVLLLGSSTNQMSALAEFADAAVVNQLRAGKVLSMPQTFPDLLKEIASPETPPAATTPSVPPPPPVLAADPAVTWEKVDAGKLFLRDKLAELQGLFNSSTVPPAPRGYPALRASEGVAARTPERLL